ncbi:MAG TPA: tetratricopeptide repeat protein, partial [Candidatus Hydrogenedentes bacterium]|nr:tetratricopeptide repeat protein [Candidatus Hydrogenedentota bacterium]
MHFSTSKPGLDILLLPFFNINDRLSFKAKACLFAIVLLAVLIRVGVFYELRQAPDYDHPVHDAEFKDYWGRALVMGDWTPPPGRNYPFEDWMPYIHPPAYPWFLGIVYRLFGLHYDIPRIIQLFLGLCSILLLFDLTRRLWGTGTALGASFLMALYFVFPFYEMDLGQTTLGVFLMLVTANGLVRLLDTPSALLSAFTGGIFACLLLTRTEFLLFLPLVVLLPALAAVRRPPRAKALLVLCAMLFGMALPTAPVVLRNYRHSEAFPVLSGDGPAMLYYSNNPWSTGTNPDSPDLRAFIDDGDWTLFAFPKMYEDYAASVGIPPRSYKALADHFMGKTRAYVRDNPGTTLRRAAKKALYFWGPMEIDENKVVWYEKQHSPVLRYLPRFPLAVAAFLTGLAMLVKDYLNRRRGGAKENRPYIAAALLLCCMAAYTAIYAAFYVTARYRVSILPFMMVFGGYGLYTMAGLARTKRYVAFAGWSLVFVFLYGLAHIDIVPFTPDIARWHDERRQAWTETNRLEDGVADLDRWLKRNPQDAYGYYNQGVMLFDLGRVEDALARFEKALALKPDYDTAYYNLGLSFFELGRHEEAARAFETRLQKAPEDADAWYGLSRVRQQAGNTTGQAEALEKAIAVNPGHARALVDLSVVKREAGDLQAAETLLQQALEYTPGYGMAEFNLGLLLKDRGHYTDGLRHLEAALGTDEAN